MALCSLGLKDWAMDRRTFKLTTAEPPPASYGEDLYPLIFGSDVAAFGRHASYHL
jgi:hypothetical protein